MDNLYQASLKSLFTSYRKETTPAVPEVAAEAEGSKPAPPKKANPLERLFAGLSPEPAQRMPGLMVLPLVSEHEPQAAYISMKRAFEVKDLLIEEVSEGGTVSELVVTNTGSIAVLLTAGEEVKGAKQNRIFNTSILLEPHSRHRVPVSCTERGRWRYTDSRFSGSDYVAPPSVRASKMASVGDRLRAFGAHHSDQQALWARVDEFHARSGTRSRTSALRDAMDGHKRRAEEARERLVRVPGQVGFVAFTGSDRAGMELISRPEVYAELHDKLMLSYVADGFGMKGDVVPEGRMNDLVASLAHGQYHVRYRSPGAGNDLRVTYGGVRGSALEVGGEILHLTALQAN